MEITPEILRPMLDQVIAAFPNQPVSVNMGLSHKSDLCTPEDYQFCIVVGSIFKEPVHSWGETFEEAFTDAKAAFQPLNIAKSKRAEAEKLLAEVAEIEAANPTESKQ